MEKKEATSSLHTPTWGVEANPCSTFKVESPLITESTVCRAFNSLDNNFSPTNMEVEIIDSPPTVNDSTAINTINLEDLLNFTEEEPSLISLLEDTTPSSILLDPTAATITTASHITPLPEETIWSGLLDVPTAFEDPLVGLCLPAMEAEGNMIPLPVEENETGMEANNDILQWIMDDSKIMEDFLSPPPLQVEATTPMFILEELKPEGISPKEEKKKIKTESLTEQEKYLRMREQNNRASKACRAKRKRKLAEEEEELRVLGERNTVLRAKVESMEREVEEYKRRLIQQVGCLSAAGIS